MENYYWNPCQNCMMMGSMQHMMMEPMVDMEEEKLKMMYPDIYHRVMPLVYQHCDKHEKEHGTMHCPSKKDIDDMCDKIYKMIKDDLDDSCEEDDDDNMRVRRYGRKRAVRDLISVLLLGEFIGRRRRRKRRPRPRPYYYGY